MKSSVGGISRGRKTVPEAVAMRGKSFRVTAKKIAPGFYDFPRFEKDSGCLKFRCPEKFHGLGREGTEERLSCAGSGAKK